MNSTRAINKAKKIEAQKRLEENRKIVATGKCPHCNQDLHQNLAMTGWFQCDGFGADGFRKNNDTKCNFQLFTE